MALRDAIEQLLRGPVPPTIATDDEFRDVYCQGYRHALTDVLALLASVEGPREEKEKDDLARMDGCTTIDQQGELPRQAPVVVPHGLPEKR